MPAVTIIYTALSCTGLFQRPCMHDHTFLTITSCEVGLNMLPIAQMTRWRYRVQVTCPRAHSLAMVTHTASQTPPSLSFVSPTCSRRPYGRLGTLYRTEEGDPECSLREHAYPLPGPGQAGDSSRADNVSDPLCMPRTPVRASHGPRGAQGGTKGQMVQKDTPSTEEPGAVVKAHPRAGPATSSLV